MSPPPASGELQLLIFDFDGTLADTLPIVVSAFQSSVANTTGKRLSEPEITRHFGITEEGIMRRLVPHAWKACLEIYLKDYDAGHEGITSFPGIIPLLEKLRADKIILDVATGKGAASTEISFRRLGLTSYFSHIKTGSPDGDIKTQRIRELLGTHSIPAQSAAYIGDSQTDMKAAREAGVMAIGAGWASTAKPDEIAREHPDELFHAVDDFADWLAGRTSSSA